MSKLLKIHGRMQNFHVLIILCGLTMSIAGCAAPSTTPTPSPGTSPQTSGKPSAGKAVDPQQAERLKRLMIPLFKVMDHPLSTGQAQVAVVDDPQINAGSAGSGQFVVTSGLLQRANDEQLQAVMAHEIAHDDLGHVAKTQTMGAGLNIATILLDQVLPGSGQIAPIAGTLLIRAYGRKEEYAADRHGMELLRRIDPAKGKEMMIGALTWLEQNAGAGGGGFFATHPNTGDRIDTLRKMP